MNEELFNALLYRGESETLDFKVDQYSFEKATDDEKSELLKDILAFVNAWRDSDAFVLIGVQERHGGKALPLGISKHLEDHAVHQFVNSLAQRPVHFSCEEFTLDGKLYGIIRIPVQQRPLCLQKDFGKLKANTVYVRHGSSTDIAKVDEIADMGKVASTLAPSFIVLAKLELSEEIMNPQLRLQFSVENRGNASAYEVTIEFERAPGLLAFFDLRLWDKKPSSTGQHCQVSKGPIHPRAVQNLATWNLGSVALEPFTSGWQPPSNERLRSYLGPKIDARLRVFCKDKLPALILIHFTPEEIRTLNQKTFQGVNA